VTLVVFGRAPEPGACKTRLQPRLGAEGAAALYAALLDDTCRLAATIPGPRVLCVDGDPAHPVLTRLATEWGLSVTAQGPGDLGARMRRAMEPALASGPVCLIGSDLPTLQTADLAAGFSSLARHEVVFGPAADGGYWLVGLRPSGRAHLAALFDDQEWSTPSVLTATLARVSGAALLATHADLDEPADLDRLCAALDPRVGPATRRALHVLGLVC